MRFTRATVSLILIFCIAAAPANAATREEKRVSDSSDVLDQFLRIPEQSIPPSLLSRAYAVAVIPNVIKVGFGVGARRGKGVIVVRQDNDSWSNPAFITLTGGSLGWQIGAQSTDIILVFKTRKGVESLANGKLTLGADASIAAGPVGRHTGAATDLRFQAEVVSYSRSRGLFAGLAIEGAGVTMDRKANAAFYDDLGMSPERIFKSSPNAAPDVANTFVQMLTAQTRRLPSQPGMQSTVVEASADRESGSVRTFGIPEDGAAASDDDVYDSGY